MKVAKILCWFGRHDYRKLVRTAPPALGKEEMRCRRCEDHYLVPAKQPRFRKVYKHT